MSKSNKPVRGHSASTGFRPFPDPNRQQPAQQRETDPKPSLEALAVRVLVIGGSMDAAGVVFYAGLAAVTKWAVKQLGQDQDFWVKLLSSVSSALTAVVVLCLFVTGTLLAIGGCGALLWAHARGPFQAWQEMRARRTLETEAQRALEDKGTGE